MTTGCGWMRTSFKGYALARSDLCDLHNVLCDIATYAWAYVATSHVNFPSDFNAERVTVKTMIQ